MIIAQPALFCFFFFNDTATTEIYTLSLHDALPIFWVVCNGSHPHCSAHNSPRFIFGNVSKKNARASCLGFVDRKSTRLNSSHSQISYAVFCLKKKKTM